MALEIERKFLLKNLVFDYTHNADHVYDISQYYFENPKTKIFERVRIIEEGDKKVYYHTIKKKLREGVNEEIEKKISKIKAKNLVAKHKNSLTSISKTRYVKKEGKLKWELDVFHGMKLVILEVEMKKEGLEIILPPSLKKELIMEVTKFKEFANRSLAKKVSYQEFLSNL